MNPQRLQAAITALEHDPQALRIRKVLYATAAHKWVNDTDYLEKIPFQKLILANLKQYPMVSDLKAALQHLLTGLNKPQIYQPIEARVLAHLVPLYSPKNPEETFVGSASVNSPSEPTPPTPPIELPATLWFDLRLDVTRYVPPLRVKMLVFSSLFDQISPAQPEDWHELRTFVLTDLLADLFVQFPTFPQAKDRILQVASLLEPAQDYLVAADHLLRGIRPIYDRYGSQLASNILSPANPSFIPASPPSDPLHGDATSFVLPQSIPSR